MALDREQVATLRCLADDIGGVLDTPEIVDELPQSARDNLRWAAIDVHRVLHRHDVAHAPTGPSTYGDAA
jgi:hypothetical protein